MIGAVPMWVQDGIVIVTFLSAVIGLLLLVARTGLGKWLAKSARDDFLAGVTKVVENDLLPTVAERIDAAVVRVEAAVESSVKAMVEREFRRNGGGSLHDRIIGYVDSRVGVVENVVGYRLDRIDEDVTDIRQWIAARTEMDRLASEGRINRRSGEMLYGDGSPEPPAA